MAPLQVQSITNKLTIQCYVGLIHASSQWTVVNSTCFRFLRCSAKLRIEIVPNHKDNARKSEDNLYLVSPFNNGPRVAKQ